MISTLFMALLATGANATNATQEKAPATSAFTPEQMKTIEKIVQDQITNNPELLIKSVQQFGEKQQQESLKKLEATLNSNKDELLKASDSIAMGDDKATVKLVAFIDPNCPHCRTFEKNITQVMGDFKNVQFLYRQYPILGPDSEVVARGLVAVNMQGKFPGISEKVSTSQEKLTKEKFIELAKGVKGLDLTKLAKDMDSDTVKAQIQNTRILAEKIGIDSTPTVILADKAGARILTSNDPKTLADELKSAKS